MTDRFLFTGTGGSMGVPVVGCNCPVCMSESVVNHRLRSAGVLYAQDKAVAVDVGPDFRMQCLRYKMRHIDGVFITHTHADHVHGLDDVRALHFKQKAPIPCFLSESSRDDIAQRFGYFFAPYEGDRVHSKKLDMHVHSIEFGQAEFLGIPLTLMRYYQAGMPITGFRYKNFAYLTDIQSYSERIYEYLYGLDTLVISALRWAPSPAHFTIDDALDFVGKVSPRRALFTHIAHDLEHDETNRKLPEHVRLAYDGLEVAIEE